MERLDTGAEAVATQPETEEPDLDAIFQCLASSTRRRLLGILYEQSPEPVSRRELANQFVREDGEESLEETSDRELRHTFQLLHHDHIPRFEDAGLIEQDPEQDSVRLADHPALEDPGIVSAISEEENVESETLDTLFDALAHPQRREILDVVRQQFGSVHRDVLARHLCEDRELISELECSETSFEKIVPVLHHFHLPHLSDAGLIDYHTDERTVEFDGHPELRTAWTRSEL